MNPKRMHCVPRAVAAALLLAALCAETLAPRARGQPQGVSAPGQAPAEITVVVPADAEIFFDGEPTRQRGTQRRFVSPPLEIGRTYNYVVLARWRDGGRPVEQTRKVPVTGGARVRVDFLSSLAEDQEDQEVVASKGVPRLAATSVNFRKELNLPFATLGTLGPRIDAARQAHDPVALAHAASELCVAEAVSGKKASLTSTAVLNEAAELAKLRKENEELQAVLNVSKRVADAEARNRLLQEEIASSKARVARDQEAIRQNQEPTWTPRKVIVNNYTNDYLDLWVNGTYKVQIAPGMSQLFYIEHRWNPTVLTAYGNEDNMTWGPRYIWGRFNKYTWNIN
jgi:uncharacterized protein (TIGR03000 family)